MVQAVWAVRWTEHEYGQRPDGISLHRSQAEAERFAQKNQGGSSEQYFTGSVPQLIEVSPAVAAHVQKQGDTWGNPSGWIVDENYILNRG